MSHPDPSFQMDPNGIEVGGVGDKQKVCSVYKLSEHTQHRPPPQREARRACFDRSWRLGEAGVGRGAGRGVQSGLVLSPNILSSPRAWGSLVSSDNTAFPVLALLPIPYAIRRLVNGRRD